MVRFSSQKLRRSQNVLIQQACPETSQFQQVWEIPIFEAWASLGTAKGYSPWHSSQGSQSHRQAVLLPREVPCKNTSAKTPQNQLQSFLWLILHSSKEPFSASLYRNQSPTPGECNECKRWGKNPMTRYCNYSHPGYKVLYKPTPSFTCSSFCDWSEGKGNNYTISNHHYCFNDCISILKA